ncbi:hypothetical protein WJX74_007891 [Apatococcus lobatus]|uniref:Uncharacterized protein n=1 Tax=Apatococcus lobatus TaxID=904363 RepID=A0AAW1QMZ6_9CHLO
MKSKNIPTFLIDDTNARWHLEDLRKLTGNAGTEQDPFLISGESIEAGMSRMQEAAMALRSAVLPQKLQRKAITNLYSPAYPAREQLADLTLQLSSTAMLQEALEDFLQQNAPGQNSEVHPDHEISCLLSFLFNRDHEPDPDSSEF